MLGPLVARNAESKGEKVVEGREDLLWLLILLSGGASLGISSSSKSEELSLAGTCLAEAREESKAPP